MVGGIDGWIGMEGLREEGSRYLEVGGGGEVVECAAATGHECWK